MEYLTLHDLPQRHMHSARRMATPDELRGPERTLPALPVVCHPLYSSSPSSSSSSTFSITRPPSRLLDFHKPPVMATSSTAPASSGASPPGAPSPMEGIGSVEAPAKFLEPLPGFSPEFALPHLFSPSNSTPAVQTAAENRSGSEFDRSNSIKLPPITQDRHRPRLDSLAPVHTQSLTADMAQENHSNDDLPQNHLTRHSPPVQPNERQPSNVGLPSFSQVKHPRSNFGRD